MPTSTKVLNVGLPLPTTKSFINIVPELVPSLAQSSLPLMPLSAQKTTLLATEVIFSGLELAEPTLISFTSVACWLWAGRKAIKDKKAKIDKAKRLKRMLERIRVWVESMFIV